MATKKRTDARIHLQGRCMEGNRQYPINGTLTANGRILIVQNPQEQVEIKLSPAAPDGKRWKGGGTFGERRLTSIMKRRHFAPSHRILLEGEWIVENQFGIREDDLVGEWRWELWPVGKSDPYVRLRTKRRAKKSPRPKTRRRTVK